MSDEFDNTDSSDDTESSDSSDDDETDSDSDEPINSNPEPPIINTNPKITLKARKDARSRGRWKVLCDKKKFKPEWRDQYPWVDEHPVDPKLAICTVCNNHQMKAMRGILEAHQRSKRHIRNVAGPDYVEVKTEKPKVNKRSSTPPPPTGGMDQMDDQISFLTDSAADAAHQAVTTIIDKLVEKYHQNRLQNLKVQNETILQVNIERAKLIRSENQRKLERRLQREAFLKEAEDTELKLMQMQHDSMLDAMEQERDAKLRAVEQELVFAKQEYEKKVRLLDSQLSSMK